MKIRVRKAALGCMLGAIGLLAAGCSPGWILGHSGTIGLEYAGNGTPATEFMNFAATCTQKQAVIGDTPTPFQTCPGAGSGELEITNTFACALLGPPTFCKPTLSLFLAHTILGTFFPQGSCTQGPCQGGGGAFIFGTASIAGQSALYLYIGAQFKTKQDVSPLLLGVSALCLSLVDCNYADLGAYVPHDAMANGMQILLLFTPGYVTSHLWSAMAKDRSIAEKLYSYMLARSNYATTHIIAADSFVGFRSDADYGPLGPAFVGRLFACGNNCVHVTTLPPL